MPKNGVIFDLTAFHSPCGQLIHTARKRPSESLNRGLVAIILLRLTHGFLEGGLLVVCNLVNVKLSHN